MARWGNRKAQYPKYESNSRISATPVSRTSAFDILAVIPSGAFAFLVCYIILSGDSAIGGDLSLWSRLDPLVSELKENPAILLAVLFVSYFFGSVFRALPAEWVDASPLVGNSVYPSGTRAEDLVRGMVKTPTSSILQSNRAVLPTEVAKERLKYLKDRLRARSPERFAYYQTFEIRSGFVATMLWAATSGLFGSLLWFLTNGINGAGLQLALVSALMATAFGIWLPRVRKQETSTLVALAVSHARSRPRLHRRRRSTEIATA